MELLPKYGLHDKIIVKLLQALYRIVSASVSIHGEKSDMFNLQTGFRQGCILSPTLFNIALDNIFRQLKRRINAKCRTIPEQLFDVEYADDTALVAECIDENTGTYKSFGRRKPEMGNTDQHKEVKDHAGHKE